MERFENINTNEIPVDIIEKFKTGALLLAGDEKQSNALCINNISIGHMWDRNIVTTALKPLRYTKEFVDLNETFSINFFSKEYNQDLEYFGTMSGRDSNKMLRSDLERSMYRGTPFFTQAETVLICRKLFAEEIKETSFADKSLLYQYYIFKDYHTIYISEIKNILKLKPVIE